MQSAAVEIASGFVAGDKLSADTTGLPSITATYDSADGVLSLSGSDTVADYRAVLQSVTFNSTASDATLGGDRRQTRYYLVGERRRGLERDDRNQYCRYRAVLRQRLAHPH